MKKSQPAYEDIMRVRMSFHENGIKGITNRQIVVGSRHGGDSFLSEGLSPERAPKIRRMLRTYNAK